MPEGRERFGTVPVDPKAAYDAGTTLIGCDVGKNGDQIPELVKLGHEIFESSGIHTLFATLDHISALVVKRLIEEAFNEGVIEEGSMLGVTGRAGITGKKPELILEYSQKYFNETLFVSDALAMGAAMMARCMNSLGTPKNPVGGCQGGQVHTWTQEKATTQGMNYNLQRQINGISKMVTAIVMAGGKGTRMRS